MMSTLAELKATAYFIGLTNDEVRQHGSLAKKQTWQDAIDYAAKFQVETDTDSSEHLEVNEDKEIDDDDSCNTDGMEETDYDYDRLNDLADFPDDELISDETIAGYRCSLEQPLEDDKTLKVGDTVQHHPSGRVFEIVDTTPDENDFILVKQANSNMTLKLKKASLKKTTEKIYNWDETFGNNMVYPTLPMLYRETILERNTKLIKEGSTGVYRKLKIRYNKDFIKWRILNVLREFSADDISRLKELFNEVLEEIGSKDNE